MKGTYDHGSVVTKRNGLLVVVLHHRYRTRGRKRTIEYCVAPVGAKWERLSPLGYSYREFTTERSEWVGEADLEPIQV
jgi:hypothetical protein